MTTTLSEAEINTNVEALAAMAGDTVDTVDATAEATVERAGVVDNAAMARFLEGGTLNTERVSSPFEQVVAVNRCSRMIGDALSSMPLMVSTMDDEIVEAGEIVDFLDCPFPGLLFEDLAEWTAVLPLLTGAAYWVIEAQAGEIPTLMRPVGQGPVKPKYDPTGDLIGYQYRKPGDRTGHTTLLDESEVVPFALPNFQTQRLYDGVSQLKPASRSIEQVFAANNANLESLHNGVDPGIVFEFQHKPNADEVRDFRRMVDERHRGTFKRNRPYYSYGGAKIDTFNKPFTEMEFTKLLSMSVGEICVAMGVPPIVVGYGGEAGLGHGKELEEAHSVFWHVTVIPLAVWIARKITVHVLPRFADRARTFSGFGSIAAHRKRCPTYRDARLRSYRRSGIRTTRGIGKPLQHFAWFDSSHVDAVRDASLKRLKEMVILHEKLGATQAEVIEAADAPVPNDHPWQHTWYKPFGLVDVQEDTSDLEPPTGRPEDDTPPPPPPDDEPEDVAPPDDDSKRAQRALSDKDRDRIHGMWWLSITPLVSDARKKLEGHFRNLRAEVMANSDKVDPAKSAIDVERRNIVGRLLFDLAEADGKLIAKARPLIRSAELLGGSQSMEDAAIADGKDAEEADAFDLDSGETQRAIARRENRMTGINDTVHRSLKRRLQEAVDDGASMNELRDVIREEFNIAGNRVGTIARTEIAGAVEEGKHIGRRQAGVPLKSWLWSRRETGRPWHMATEDATHDKPIEVDDLFVIAETNNTCQHPRATGDARDDINCGCTTLSRFPGDDKDARLIAHRLSAGFLDIDTLNKRMAEPETES